MNKVARSVTKWTQACDRRFGKTNLMQSSYKKLPSILSRGKCSTTLSFGSISRTQILLETLSTRSQHWGEVCVFLVVVHLFLSFGCARSKTSVSHSSTESEINSLDAGMQMDGFPALDLWDVWMDVLRLPNNTKTPIKPASGNRYQTEECSRNSSKVKAKGSLDVQQLTQLNHVPSKAHSSQGESPLYIF